MEMESFRWGWGNGWEGHPSTTVKSLENTMPSSACHNETAALAITDVSCFMAVISFLTQKQKNALLWQEKSEVPLAACC